MPANVFLIVSQAHVCNISIYGPNQAIYHISECAILNDRFFVSMRIANTCTNNLVESLTTARDNNEVRSSDNETVEEVPVGSPGELGGRNGAELRRIEMTK